MRHAAVTHGALGHLMTHLFHHYSPIIAQLFFFFFFLSRHALIFSSGSSKQLFSSWSVYLCWCEQQSGQESLPGRCGSPRQHQIRSELWSAPCGPSRGNKGHCICFTRRLTSIHFGGQENKKTYTNMAMNSWRHTPSWPGEAPCFRPGLSDWRWPREWATPWLLQSAPSWSKYEGHSHQSYWGSWFHIHAPREHDTSDTETQRNLFSSEKPWSFWNRLLL